VLTLRDAGLALGIFLLAAIQLLGQEKKLVVPPVPSIEELIANLGDPDFAIRENAQRELWKRGDAAVPALEKALRDENPEIVRRAGELLEKFAWGVRFDTPPTVLKILREFQVGDQDPLKSAEIRKKAILELIKFGPRGISVAQALLRRNFSQEAHAQIVAQITALLQREIPLRLFEGKIDEASELIGLHLAGTGPEGAADFASFHFLRGSLPAAIAATESAAKSSRDANNHRLILTHLFRASGEWAKARATAADVPTQADTSSLVELLCEEEGDWPTLADTIQLRNANHPDAVLLTLLRLEGKQKEFDDNVNRIKREASEFSSTEEVTDAVVALLSNHRVEEGTKILLERKQNLGLLAETLISRLRYKEALELAVGDGMLPKHEKLAFDLRRARLLMLTGHREGAVQLFNKLANGLASTTENPGESVPLVRSLLRAEVRVGLKDLAAEHAAIFLAGDLGRFDRVGGESVFEILFGQDSTVAESIYMALWLIKNAGDEPGRIMAQVRNLLSGKASKVEVDAAIKQLDVWGKKTDRSSERARDQLRKVAPYTVRAFLALAAVNRADGRHDDAEAAYKSAAESMSGWGGQDVDGPRSWAYGTSEVSRPWLEWGDFLMERGRFRDASVRFVEGWKKFPDQPLLLFLSGNSLVKAGDVKEGERRMELSHWVSLGQERIRGRFLDELIRRGEGKAAQRETELILRACWPRDHYFGNVMNQASRAAVLNNDFNTAEKCVQRSLLVILKTPGVYFVETSAYMNVPHVMLVYRALARLGAGKVDEAMAIARDALAVTPGHLFLISAMVPELDRLGRKAEADELFGIAWSAYEKVLTDSPDSPFARNALAALSANCRRELDKGQAHALAAFKADPDSAQYRETLAEVFFRQGKRDKATDAMLKLIEEEPRNQFYKRQLKRYRDGPLDSAKPERADE
jgi:tetratricopeptide (TPR) repeat protein